MQLSIHMSPAMSAVSRFSHIRFPVTLIAHALTWGRQAARRAGDRAALAGLSAREKEDIGYGRVLDELSKPFWRE